MQPLRDKALAESNWKSTAYVAGGVVGLLIGLAAAHLYARAADENQVSQGKMPGPINTADAFKLALTLLGLVRQISDLGAKPPERK